MAITELARWQAREAARYAVSQAGARPLAEVEAERMTLILGSDPGDQTASAKISALTREYAAGLLALPLRGSFGGLTVYTGGWSRERADAANAAAEPGSEAWHAALGNHEHATLTSDGRHAERTSWCTGGCAAAAEWVRYEHWTADGRQAHGFVCPACRKLTQTG